MHKLVLMPALGLGLRRIPVHELVPARRIGSGAWRVCWPCPVHTSRCFAAQPHIQASGPDHNDNADFQLLPAACGAMAGAVALSNYLVQFPIGWIGTWGTAVFPICFLITDLTNRFGGAARARTVVYTGFAVGVPASLLVSEPRIALASGAAFLLSQLLDVKMFDALRGHRVWWAPPLISSMTASALDSTLFCTVAFLGTEMPSECWPIVGELPHWVTWAVGDFLLKSGFAVANLLPYSMASAKTAANGGHHSSTDAGGRNRQ